MSDQPMASRGVSRPMAEKQMKKKSEQDSDSMEMLRSHHKQTLWVYWTLIILGVWLILAPFTFGYGKDTVMPSGGRDLWLTLDQRISLSIWNDVVCGILLIIFGWRSLQPNRPISLWAACFVGIYISMAPLVFWAPTAVAYYNDTIVGAMVIALTILIPGMPNMIAYMKKGPQVPPGWSYNPSSWPQRWIMIVTGFLGWIVSRYLATFQLGYINSVWDPFFGRSSELVLNSSMSHSLPISDAGLGALAYTFEFLMGWMGSPARWRTMPWMVTFFGILVIPLGLVHIALVISQPIVVGHWCTFCLMAAAIMLPMIPLEIDEVFAMFDFLRDAKKRKLNMWRAFWKGGTMEAEGMDERSPELMELSKKPGPVLRAAFWGMNFPWTLGLSTCIGIYLMFSPAIFNLSQWGAHIFHLGGALVVVASVIAMGEIVRIGRYFNLLIGLALAALPWFLAGSSPAGNINGLIAAICVMALSIPVGKRQEKFGYWERWIK